MIGSKQISTSEEKEIARNLPYKRAKVFLESRAFIRECLSNLLGIKPLEIPLKAYPGEIPKIPKEIGNISISHTKDTLIVIWDENRIGIDMEKTNRNFNYKSLAEKYFRKNTEMTDKLKINKNYVLKNWSAVEAAIKWDGGKLSKDLKNWKYLKKKGKIIHENKKIELQLNQFEYKDWTISIAMQNKTYQNDQFVICDYGNNYF